MYFKCLIAAITLWDIFRRLGLFGYHFNVYCKVIFIAGDYAMQKPVKNNHSIMYYSNK